MVTSTVDKTFDSSYNIIINLMITRVYNKEGGRVSYSSIVPCTAVVRVQARLMIFTMCGTFTVYTTWQARCVLRVYGFPQ